MFTLIITALTATFVGSWLAWTLRGTRARVAEASATARFQSLDQYAIKVAAELRDLKAVHAQLVQERLQESIGRASAEALATQLPEMTGNLARASAQISTQIARIATLESELANANTAVQEQRQLLQQSSVALSDSFKGTLRRRAEKQQPGVHRSCQVHVGDVSGRRQRGPRSPSKGR